jgi:dihydrofolate reductase
MGRVIAGFAMSLDGFIAGADDDVGLLFRWLASGDTPLHVMGRTFMTSPASAAHYLELLSGLGAHVTGRRDFDVSRAWGGHHPLDVPVFVVTHEPPAEWSHDGSPFTFVTGGVESALARAGEAAGDKTVLVSGSQIARQCLDTGLLDTIHIDLVPVLLGSGIRLFDNLAGAPIELEVTSVVDAPGVTHLKYRVMRQST